MDSDIKVEIIYFCHDSDIKLEFGLRGEYPLRLLTNSCNDFRSFLSALKKSVARSEVIITVGGFFGDKYLPDILGRSIGQNCKDIDLTKYNSNNVHETMFLPDGAIPLISSDGKFGGCIIESGPQIILMLTEENRVRLSLLFELVLPYITEHYKFCHGIKDCVPSPLANDSEKANAEITTPNFHDSNNANIASIMDKPAPQDEPISEQNISTPASHDEPNSDKDLPEPVNPKNQYHLIKNNSFITDENANLKKAHTKHLQLIIICIVAVLLFVVGGCFAYLEIYLPRQAASFYNKMYSLYLDNSFTLGSEDYTSKFVNLTNIDSNVCGWISAPGTKINYPVVSLSPEKDESYYKTHLLDGTYNKNGTPYLSSNFSGKEFFRNYVIFGNSTQDSAMFSNLSLYLDQDFCNTATTVQFDSIFDEGNWRIFSVFSYDGESPLDLKNTDFASDIEYFAYINSLIKNSDVELDTEISAKDPIIVLISESDESTIVVAAKLIPTITSQSTLVNSSTNSAESNAFSETTSIEETSSAKSSEIKTSSETSSITNIISSETETVSVKFEQAAPVAAVPANVIPDGMSGNVILTVKNSSTGKTITGNSEDILAMIVEAEMGSGYPLEALKAQVVATYSYLLTNGAASGNAPPVPIKTAESRVKEAVSATLGQKAMFEGNVAQTCYYAISAGFSANSQDIWGNNFSYLQSVDSSVDSSVSGFSTTRVYSASDIASWILEEYKIDVQDIEESLWFVPEYDKNGLYCTYVTIGQQARVKGTDLKNYLFTAERVGSGNLLRSSAYQISYSSASDNFIFTVKGYGHGVGMSQCGAKAYANQGWTYTQILQHYYSGITIE